MRELFWILPALFIFHDFEEIIFIEKWIKKWNEELLFKQVKIKKVQNFILSYDNLNTATFAKEVYILYIILMITTIISYFQNLETLWISIFIIFTLHLFGHCLQAIIFKGYIPALFTSIICIPLCLFIIVYIFVNFEYALTDIIIHSIFIGIAVVALLYMLHKRMKNRR